MVQDPRFVTQGDDHPMPRKAVEEIEMVKPDYPYAATLTVEAVKQYVEYVDSLRGDPEAGRMAESALHREVLTAIAISHFDKTDAVLAALASIHPKRVEFARRMARA
jgi:hypothetical protein